MNNNDRHTKYIQGNTNTAPSSSNDITMTIDVRTLDIICKCIVSDNAALKRGHLVNIKNFITSLDPSCYKNDPEKEKRVSFILKGTEARLNKNLTDPYMILTHIYGGILDSTIINLDEFKGLTTSEITWINSMISEALKYMHIESNIDDLMNICNKIKSAGFSNPKAELVEEFEGAINKIQNEFRRSKNESETDGIFSLRDGYFQNIMYDTYNTLSSPRRKLITGMQGLNELIGGGFENGRCYTFFGLPGEGKSTVMLNILYQLKKYNKDYRTKDPTKKPCIVLLTMENTVTESIERLFGMATGNSDMTNFSPEAAIEMLRDKGELYLNDESPIDIIIHFKPSNSVDTTYLYTLTEDLEDQGLEVIAMFQDYIGRIRSTQRYVDARLEYGAIVDEFKTYAEIKDIPIITVAQLNRDASKHIDEGRKTSKSDLVRLIGRSNISESMLILNNIDAGFVIAPEITNTGERFLGVQRIKIRYHAGDLEFAYLPFVKNTLKLEEDYGGIPCYKKTMREDFECPMATHYSDYQVNPIKDMGLVMQSNDDDNIFSGSMISAQNFNG